MKPYFEKELTERPRRGGKYTYRAVRGSDRVRIRAKGKDEDYEDHGETKMRKVYGWDRKEFDDHLSPVRRWLRRQVGRPWDKVWSEICELNLNSVLGKHLRDHVYQAEGLGGMVKPYSEVLLRREGSKRYYYHRPGDEYGYAGLWIDQHGILRYHQRTPNLDRHNRQKERQEPEYIQLSDHSWLAKRNGLWFEHLGLNPRKEVIEDVNYWNKKKIQRETGKVVYSRVVKRSLNKKELRDRGLTNDNTAETKPRKQVGKARTDIDPKTFTPRSLYRPWPMKWKGSGLTGGYTF